MRKNTGVKFVSFNQRIREINCYYVDHKAIVSVSCSYSQECWQLTYYNDLVRKAFTLNKLTYK